MKPDWAGKGKTLELTILAVRLSFRLSAQKCRVTMLPYSCAPLP
jgi:hypothetical protein